MAIRTVGEKESEIKYPVTQLDFDFASLEADVKRAYEEGVSLEDAERLAAKVLVVQMQIAEQLKSMDLDTRMRKTGVKAIRANTYLGIIERSEKKPTEGQLEHMVNSDKAVIIEQNLFDTTEVARDNLMLYFNIFKEAHIYFRGIAKGRFE